MMYLHDDAYVTNSAFGAKQNLPLRTPSQSLEKLARIAKYRDGWAYGEGRAFSENAIKIATMLVGLGGTTDVFPGRNGEITVTFYRDADSYDFIVGENSMRAIHETESGDEIELSLIEAFGRLFQNSELGLMRVYSAVNSRQIFGAQIPVQPVGIYKWNLSEFCTQTNTNLIGNVSRVLLSSQMPTAIFQCSRKTAPYVPPVRSVITSIGSTRR
jgi:hypothetical protein